jgi:precorrin-2 dehydrogenase/sirohydrochlorin ferrochelatase
MSLFPIFVKLQGRPVLLVGAGPVAESKVGGLISAGARVTVVAPQATPRIRELAREATINWRQREFEPSDLEGVALVVAAVPAHIATRLYHEARSRNILVNSVDDPDNCDFYYPAVVDRGDLQIAISTAGHSPALAQRIRIELLRSARFLARGRTRVPAGGGEREDDEDREVRHLLTRRRRSAAAHDSAAPAAAAQAPALPSSDTLETASP